MGKYIGQIFLVSFLLLFALLQTYCGPQILPQDACGFAQNSLGQRISWKQQLPVHLYFDSQFPQEMRPDVNSAITTWENAAGHKLFQMVGDSSKTEAHDNANVIYWLSSWDNSTQDSRNQQANTLSWWADNQMMENDIVVNNSGAVAGSNGIFVLSDNPSPGSNQIDVMSLMIHELGHVLGLKHITEPSVMNKNLEYGQIRRSLYAVDVADLKCEY